MDLDRYAQLLADARPMIIESEEEHERALNIAESLMEKGEAMSGEDRALLALFVLLIEAFERAQHAAQDDDEDSGPVELPDGHVTLQRLMTARGLEIHDIAPLFGTPHIAREVLEGKRPISQRQAKELGKYFRMPPKIFAR